MLNFFETINREQRNVIAVLVRNSKSCLVYYPNPRPEFLDANWFFVADEKFSCFSVIIPFSKAGCDGLVKSGILSPALAEDEFRLQLVVGSCHSQVYRISSEEVRVRLRENLTCFALKNDYKRI